jgi:hypothetical protein
MSSSYSSPSSSSASANAPIDLLSEGSLRCGTWGLGKATMLMISAVQGSKRSFDKILAKGARVDVKNERSLTAMHFAAKAKCDNSEIIRELHHQGLSVVEENPMQYVTNAGTATALIELGANPNEYMTRAASHGNEKLLKAMINGGGVVSDRLPFEAAWYGRTNILKMLFELGILNLASVNHTYTPRTLAQTAFNCGKYDKGSRSKLLEVINFLKDVGAPDEIPGVTTMGPVYGVDWND